MSAIMDLDSKLYQSTVVDRIAKTEWGGQNSGPLVVELDPTAACDLACPGCISEDIIAVGGRFSNTRLMELGEEFIEAGVNAVILIGGGEPLTHPKIGEFISFMGERDIHIGITTNGTLIHRHLQPIARYSKWTRVSMDAASAGLFNILRPAKNKKNRYRQIINNMRMLADAKHGKLGFSYLIQTEADGPGIVSNIHEIYDAAVLAKDIGCDYFEVKPTYQFRENVPHALVKHDPEKMEEAKRQIERLDELETADFKILLAINLKYSLTGVDSDQPKAYKFCPSTHLRTTVTPLGVYVCPYWRGKKDMCIGDVNENNFSDVWQGGRRQAVMNRLDAGKDCNFHCLRHETNQTCADIKNQLQQGITVKTVEEFDRFI